MTAEQTNLFSDMEIWEVKARNKTFRLRCNRPLLVKTSLDKYSLNWLLIEGQCPLEFQKVMQEALVGLLDQIKRIVVY